MEWNEVVVIYLGFILNWLRQKQGRRFWHFQLPAKRCENSDPHVKLSFNNRDFYGDEAKGKLIQSFFPDGAVFI